MIGILGGGLALGGKTNDSFAIPGTESQNAIDRLSAVFPAAAGAAAAGEPVISAPAGRGPAGRGAAVGIPTGVGDRVCAGPCPFGRLWWCLRLLWRLRR